jgi:hypothetical protein
MKDERKSDRENVLYTFLGNTKEKYYILTMSKGLSQNALSE